ncbi:MAG: putative sulfatase [Ignavibacteria bacterium]|nr:MAG: putative sulfatase [Ignavibacteria bacterium]KAF0161011.1 MAG: putative sulfatase [Ignavibacteria bacterium]
MFMLAVYTALRAGFFLYNSDFYQDVPAHQILYAFVSGIRFDIAALMMINLPVLILYNMPIRLNKVRLNSHFFFVFFCFLNLLGIGLNIADYAYYPTIQRRLLFEPFTETLDLIRMFPGLFKNYAQLILAFFLFASLFVWIALKVCKLVEKKIFTQFSYWRASVSLVLIMLLAVTGIRGGLQLKPIRQTNAFFSDSKPLGYLALNSTYTVIRCYFQYTFPDYNFYTNDESSSIVSKLIKSDDEEMLNKEYPFLRIKKPNQPMERKNIVVFIMESWSAEYIGSISGLESSTPFFDSIAKKGILYTNFLANGQRSIEAVPSILASLPAVFPSSIIGSRVEINKIRGLGSILLEHGYTTSFHHGAASGSMGFDAFVPSAGFLNYYSKSEFTNYADSLYDGAWGIFDEPFFLDAGNKINQFKEPFCSVIFSLSPHDPFKIPENRKQLFAEYKQETAFQAAMRYSDFSIQKFFEFAEKQHWYNNTVFVITGDHTFYTARNDIFSSFHIPLLIFDPAKSVSKKETKIGTHVDILPTILDLLHIPTVHSSMGRSLLDEKLSGFGAMTFYPNFLYFDDKSVYLDDFEKRKEFYKSYKSTDSKYNSYLRNKNESKEMERKLKAYVQATSKAVNHDLIYKKIN